MVQADEDLIPLEALLAELDAAQRARLESHANRLDEILNDD